MPSQKLSIDQPAEAIDAAEARMRLALGLTGSSRPAPAGPSGGSQGHAPQQQGASHDSTRPQRRRFAQDGDVPVVMLNRSREPENGGESRLQTLSSELRDERNNRQRAERALDEANLSIQSLKTKLAHADMAFEERLREEREARSKIEMLRSADQDARQQAERKEAEAALALALLERRVGELEADAASARSALASALATATLNAAPGTDLFGDVPSDAPVRKARQARKPAVSEAEPELAAPEWEDAPEQVPVRAAKLSAKAAAKAALAAVSEKPAGKRASKAPAAAEEAELPEDDQPVEWWLPSFRATRTAGATRRRKTG